MGVRSAPSEPSAGPAGTCVVRLWRSGSAVSISIETRADSNVDSGVQVFTDLDDAVAAVGTFLEEQWRRMNQV